MFGDFILLLRERWKQFWCIHNYKYRDLPADCSHFYCTKCGKIKKNVVIMDYEKKYKDAIPYIKDLIEHNVISKESAGKYFPELKESEDERIRKGLIAGFVDKLGFKWYGLEVDDIIAWLEKQSQENMIEALRLEYEKGKADTLQEQRKEWTAEDLLNRNEIMDILKEYNRDDLINWLEKQKQKSTTQHKFNIGDTIKYVGDREEFTREEHKIKEVLNDCYLTTHGTYLPFKFEDYYILAEQNSTRSEEDEHRINDTIYFLDTAKRHYASTEELDACINWLKSLKDRVLPQSKREWSEEDEEFRKLVIARLHSHTNVEFEEYSKEYNWLKSLKDRYTWEPTEKQMYILNWVANILMNKDGLVENNAAETLNSLYNNLKKLKG